jgi:hypothetical protein
MAAVATRAAKAAAVIRPERITFLPMRWQGILLQLQLIRNKRLLLVAP